MITISFQGENLNEVNKQIIETAAQIQSDIKAEANKAMGIDDITEMYSSVTVDEPIERPMNIVGEELTKVVSSDETVDLATVPQKRKRRTKAELEVERKAKDEAAIAERNARLKIQEAEEKKAKEEVAVEEVAVEKPQVDLTVFKQTFPSVIAKLLKDGKINQEYISAMAIYFGVKNLWEVAKNDDQIAMVYNEFLTNGLI